MTKEWQLPFFGSQIPALLEDMCSEKEENTDEYSSGDDEDGKEKKLFTSSARPRDESPNSKRERKNTVKASQRAKRIVKVPKHIKKRKEKLSQIKGKK